MLITLTKMVKEKNHKEIKIEKNANKNKKVK